MSIMDGARTALQSVQLLSHILREQVVAPRLDSIDSIPRRIDQINAGWLTEVLCKDVPGARVSGIEFGRGSTGTSDRRQVLITYNSAGLEAGLPSSVFVKATPGFFTSLGHSVSGTIAGETWFYRSIKPRLTGPTSIESPIGYHSAHDLASSKSIHLIEDLVATKGASFCDGDTLIDIDLARKMVRILATLHGAFYRSPLLQEELQDLQSYADFFRKADGVMNLRKYHLKGLDKARDVIPAEFYRRREESWSAVLKATAMHEGDSPQTILHSDVHLANWYITDDNNMGLLDWQVVSRGHWSRDLAYCVASCLTVENRRAWERELIAAYLDRFKAVSGVGIPFEDAWNSYRQQVISALALWTPTYAPPAMAPKNMQPEALAREMVRRMSIAAHELDSLGALKKIGQPGY